MPTVGQAMIVRSCRSVSAGMCEPGSDATSASYLSPVPLTPELHELARRVSNWGRWGTDDQRGTLNLIDTDAVQRGVQSARTGRPFSLAIPFDQTGPQWDSKNMPERVNPELHTYAVNATFTGDTDDFTTSDDSFRMGSQAATHVDALAHAGYEGKLWNDTPSSVVSESGASRLGIEHVGAVATRGVLLDIARLHGVDHFDEAYAITGDDLQAAAIASGVVVQSGDAVLVRTGQMHFLRGATRSATRCRRRDSPPSRSNGSARTTWPWWRPTRSRSSATRARTRRSSCPCT